jgi:hypothetical protein
MMRTTVYRDLMSDTPPEPPAAPDALRREVEQKIDELEKRLDDVERRLAERNRIFGGQPCHEEGVPDVPPDKPDPIAD